MTEKQPPAAEGAAPTTASRGNNNSSNNNSSKSTTSVSASPAAEAATARVAAEIGITGCLSLTGVVEFPDEECLIVRLSPDRGLWAVGLTNGKVQLYRTDTGALAHSLMDPAESREKQTVTGLAFVQMLPPEQGKPGPTPQRQLLLASYATGQIRMWHYAAAAEPLLWIVTEERATAAAGDGVRGRGGGSNNQILCLACAADGARFLTGGADGSIRVYDTRSRSLLNLCQSGHSTSRVDGHKSRVCALAYHPQGRQRPGEFGHLFVSGGWDNTVQIWDDRRPHSLWVYFGPHVCGSDAIDVDPMQGHILTGSWERQKSMLQVWKFNDDAAQGRLDLDDKSVQEDMLRGRPLGELQQDPAGAPSMGYVAQWLGTHYMVFGGSNANVLKIVDRGSLNIVAGVAALPKGVYSLAATPPEPGDPRRSHRLAFCAGNRLYAMKFERK